MSIPTEIQSLRAWLVWGLPNSTTRKQPYYASGAPRTGRNGSIEDRAKLVTNAEARTAKANLKAEGVGIALLPENNLVALDFDGCVDGGTVRPEVLALVQGTYAEISPSGNGVRAFFKGVTAAGSDNKTPEEKQAGEFGFEVFTDTKYVTVTGKQIPGTPDTLAELPQSVRDYAAQRFGPKVEHAATATASTAEVVELTPQQLADVATVLQHPAVLAAASSNDWWSNSVGYPLRKHGLRDLWLDFSRRAANHEEGAPEKWWDTHAAGSSDFRHLLVEAERVGCPNPGAHKSEPAAPEEFKAVTPEAAGGLLAAVPVGEVPFAQSICSDLANANRLRDAYGKKLMSVAGSFYAWCGTHWQRDEGEAARCAARLSAIVKVELQGARAQYEILVQRSPEIANTFNATARPDQSKSCKALAVTPEGAALLQAAAKIEALEKWIKQCDMLHTREAALNDLRKLLTLDASKLDADPWLFNCQSGTIDLRTGEPRPHNPADHITRCAPVKFNREAQAPRFERFLTEIMDGDTSRADFLRRWFGYCMTGSAREQQLIVHVGPGGNGKGTLLTAVSDVMGEYAGTAAPGLLAGATGMAERHPTEIADLAGRRMVTAHEPDDGAVLREGFLKQATGEDTLKARRMREDFFEFRPTHKLQLLTNHKPTIRGQDYGIWRRLLLVVYPVKFGSAEDVAAGKAAQPRDNTLGDTLRAEREGIFAWLIRGAVEWNSGGLKAPESVLSAGRTYQREQDRVAQFVDERCILDPTAWSPLTGQPWGLYPAYSYWCKTSGFNPIGKTRFSQELERVVPGFKRVEKKQMDGAVRRSAYGCLGLRLDPEDMGGEVYTSVPETKANLPYDDAADLLGGTIQ